MSLSVGGGGAVWGQKNWPLVTRNSSLALLTASALCHYHTGGISAQDQICSPSAGAVSGCGNPAQDRKFVLFLVPLLTHSSIVELIVGSSRARQHASSCVWNRGRLFINNPPHTRPRPDRWRPRWTLKHLRMLGSVTGWVWVLQRRVGEIIKRWGTTWVFEVWF